MPVKTLDLFSGIGGHALALHGYAKTIAYCDNAPFTHEVLKARMADGKLDKAPIFDDVTKLKASDLPEKPTLITASFPCQDISTAGHRKGIEKGKTRSGLVWEVFRIIDELGAASPLRAVYFENSPMLRIRGLENMIEALKERGFKTAWGDFKASDVGARHKRTRIWVLAVRGTGTDPGDWKRKLPDMPLEKHTHPFAELEKRLPRLVPKPENKKVVSGFIKRWATLGNAVVPQASHAAFSTLLHMLRKGVEGELGELCDSYPHCADIDKLYPKDKPLHIDFTPGKKAPREFQLWLTPVFSKSHFFPADPAVFRNQGMFATRLFLERETQRQFGQMKNVVKDGKPFMINIEWLEALMGFPKDWTRVAPPPGPPSG